MEPIRTKTKKYEYYYQAFLVANKTLPNESLKKERKGREKYIREAGTEVCRMGVKEYRVTERQTERQIDR